MLWLAATIAKVESLPQFAHTNLKNSGMQRK